MFSFTNRARRQHTSQNSAHEAQTINNVQRQGVPPGMNATSLHAYSSFAPPQDEAHDPQVESSRTQEDRAKASQLQAAQAESPQEQAAQAESPQEQAAQAESPQEQAAQAADVPASAAAHAEPKRPGWFQRLGTWATATLGRGSQWLASKKPLQWARRFYLRMDDATESVHAKGVSHYDPTNQKPAELLDNLASEAMKLKKGMASHQEVLTKCTANLRRDRYRLWIYAQSGEPGGAWEEMVSEADARLLTARQTQGSLELTRKKIRAFYINVNKIKADPELHKSYILESYVQLINDLRKAESEVSKTVNITVAHSNEVRASGRDRNIQSAAYGFIKHKIQNKRNFVEPAEPPPQAIFASGPNRDNQKIVDSLHKYIGGLMNQTAVHLHNAKASRAFLEEDKFVLTRKRDRIVGNESVSLIVKDSFSKDKGRATRELNKVQIELKQNEALLARSEDAVNTVEANYAEIVQTYGRVFELRKRLRSGAPGPSELTELSQLINEELPAVRSYERRAGAARNDSAACVNVVRTMGRGSSKLKGLAKTVLATGLSVALSTVTAGVLGVETKARGGDYDATLRIVSLRERLERQSEHLRHLRDSGLFGGKRLQKFHLLLKSISRLLVVPARDILGSLALFSTILGVVLSLATAGAAAPVVAPITAALGLAGLGLTGLNLTLNSIMLGINIHQYKTLEDQRQHAVHKGELADSIVSTAADTATLVSAGATMGVQAAGMSALTPQNFAHYATMGRHAPGVQPADWVRPVTLLISGGAKASSVIADKAANHSDVASMVLDERTAPTRTTSPAPTRHGNRLRPLALWLIDKFDTFRWALGHLGTQIRSVLERKKARLFASMVRTLDQAQTISLLLGDVMRQAKKSVTDSAESAA